MENRFEVMEVSGRKYWAGMNFKACKEAVEAENESVATSHICVWLRRKRGWMYWNAESKRRLTKGPTPRKRRKRSDVMRTPHSIIACSRLREGVEDKAIEIKNVTIAVAYVIHSFSSCH